MSRDELVALKKRVDEATGFDGGLGDDIWELVRDPASGSLFRTSGNPITSIDTALALVERILPGWHWSLEAADAEFGLARPRAHLIETVHDNGKTLSIVRKADGVTPALAIVSVLLAALIAKEPGHAE